MRHAQNLLIVGMALWGSVSLAHAGDWQPITRADSDPTTAPPVVARLAKPIVKSPAIAVESQSGQRVSAKLGTPQVVRAQGPDAGPPPVDERFASGEVIDRSRGPGHPWSGLSTSYATFGEVVTAPVTWVKSWGFTFESDHFFDDLGFISPSSNPFFFEDPRALTEVRPILLYEKSPAGNALNNGGSSFFFGLQGRVAFNQQFSLVLHKLGGIDVSPEGGILVDATDFAELWLGGKFTFLRDDSCGSIAAFGLNFEIPIGGGDAYQNTGNGALTPYISYAQQLWTDWHFMTTFGYRLGFNDERSDSFFLSLHLDYNIAHLNKFFPFVEFNWFHYTANGTNLAVGNEGRDLYNFGATDVTGNDIVTMALGMRFKITPCIEFGGYYEFPISNREDLTEYRVGLDVLFRY